MSKAVTQRPSKPRQPSFRGLGPLEEALGELAGSGIEERGAIYTRREVVEFILDLVGYTADKPLYEQSLLEPSFGGGDFLLIAIERLLEACKADSKPVTADSVSSCIRAVELHKGSFAGTRSKLADLLQSYGVPQDSAASIIRSWLIHDDFLLTDLPEGFDYVVGNPPYVRQELVPNVLLEEYRARYRTIFDRADIYIPFIERSLNLLSKGGALGFICADRWMKNRYGGPLRELVSEGFHLSAYVDMVDTPAFHTDVIAYPAVTVIRRESPGATRIAHQPEISKSALTALASELTRTEPPAADSKVKELGKVADGAQPWILETSDQLALVRRLERDFPTIEEAGCKVGIGVATGADKAFIAPYDEIDVEPDRKLRLALTRDIASGEVRWRGYGIVNPFADEGGLVDLDRYPRLKKYLEDRKDQIAKRHIAKKAPARWYRTIDRIYPALANEPKLLIPDIKGDAQIVYEPGKLYPHHNLYYITSQQWDLRALQAVLLSGIARLFITTYSTRMRGGYLRFQAQYLRRIRLPRWQDVAPETMNELVAAAQAHDVVACNRAVFRLYGLSPKERQALGGNGD